MHMNECHEITIDRKSPMIVMASSLKGVPIAWTIRVGPCDRKRYLALKLINLDLNANIVAISHATVSAKEVCAEMVSRGEGS